jgi:hypothetical protein
MPIRARSHYLLILACIAFCLMPNQRAAQTSAQGTAQVQLTTAEIVQKLVDRNAKRAKALEGYRGRRAYGLDYVGFPANLHATMIVDVKYTAPATKEFTVVSQSGSRWVIDHVFKRLLETEREALEGENWKRTSLDSKNYDFTLVADPRADEHCPYTLEVEPKVTTKFLYRGRIWVDAKDFAVCRIEAEPAKNPSFWIKRTDISHVYFKMGNFWLPKENKSVSVIRLGGRATLTIEYQNYEILTASPIKETSGDRALQ